MLRAGPTGETRGAPHDISQSSRFELANRSITVVQMMGALGGASHRGYSQSCASVRGRIACAISVPVWTLVESTQGQCARRCWRSPGSGHAKARRLRRMCLLWALVLFRGHLISYKPDILMTAPWADRAISGCGRRPCETLCYQW
jgi:hypothetical protein